MPGRKPGTPPNEWHRRRELVSYRYIAHRARELIEQYAPDLLDDPFGRATREANRRLADTWIDRRGFPKPYYHEHQRAELMHDECLYDRKRVEEWIERIGNTTAVAFCERERLRRLDG